VSEPRFDRDDAPMPAWRGRSAFVSAGLHVAPIVIWFIVASIPPAPESRAIDYQPPHEITRIFVPPVDEPFAIDHPIPPEQLSGYELSGLPFNLAKIAARREALFPFLTADLSFLDRLSADLRASSATLRNPLGPTRMPELALDAGAIQQLIDESWSRRDRWRRFATVAFLLQAHNPNDGKAPGLMRAYLDQNLLQPYCAGKTKDGQFWALLENASDHADFLDFIRRMTRTRSSSRTTTELLFLMDELAQANREAATTLVATNISKDLGYSAVNAPRTVLLAAQVANGLRYWFASQGLSAESNLREEYDRRRLRILATIVETTPNGYRQADARFLAGEIFFRQGDIEQAVEWWRPMNPVDGDTYAAAARAIRDVVNRNGRLDEYELRRILSVESARWSEINYTRMMQFGYRCDSY
jgi:hypothetical protein